MRLPDKSQHLSIVGANGSGKSVAELWHISQQDLAGRIVVIFNWKHDEGIDGIPFSENIPLYEIPTKPGVYIYHPVPEQDDDEVTAVLWEIWRRGNMCVVIDEGFMIKDRNPAFRALLTQGRSKGISLIVLSQRPVWMDRFVFSESMFFQVFRLQHRKDRKAVQEFIPKNIDKRLPEYHSYYYDVGRDEVVVLQPVPPLEDIYKTFNRKLAVIRKTV